MREPEAEAGGSRAARATPSRHHEALRVAGVSKRFGDTLVLDRFELALAPGEVHGLVGHNGSGKSTFVKILAGYHEPEPGSRALVRGAPLALGDPHAAHAAGLRFVHQDLGLVPYADAVDNVHLDNPYPRGRLGRIDWPAARAQTEQVLASLGYAFDVGKPVDLLSAVDRTGVALARALMRWEAGTHVLVLDEPTAALPAASVQRLFDAIRRISANGIAVLYISHHLDELFQICERLTVLRNGRTVARFATDALAHDALVEAMLGKPVEVAHHAPAAARGGETVLTVDGLRGAGVEDVSFAVARGEVLGFAGLSGSGREELPALLYGTAARGGAVAVHGRPVPPGRPDAAIAGGMGLVPANRARNALIPTMNVRENLTIGRLPSQLRGGFLSRRRERDEVGDWLDRLDVRPRDPELDATKLSGGNQQRLMLGRWLRLEPAVLLLDEPTQGVDVGAIELIYALIREAVEAGAAVVVFSSSADELVALCDRVIVMRRGRARHELHQPHIDSDAIDALTLTD